MCCVCQMTISGMTRTAANVTSADYVCGLHTDTSNLTNWATNVFSYNDSNSGSVTSITNAQAASIPKYDGLDSTYSVSADNSVIAQSGNKWKVAQNPETSGVRLEDGQNAIFQIPSAVTGDVSPPTSSVRWETWNGSSPGARRDFDDFYFELEVKAVAQTRVGTSPNWEIPWIIFRRTGSLKQYWMYFRGGEAATPGAVLGKDDKASLPENDIFIWIKPGNGTAFYPTPPVVQVGTWYKIRGVVDGNHIWAEMAQVGQTPVRYINAKDDGSGETGDSDAATTPMSTELSTGSFNLYNEDCESAFRNIVLIPLEYAHIK